MAKRTQVYADGTYEGAWRDGKRHGLGTFSYIDGRRSWPARVAINPAREVPVVTHPCAFHTRYEGEWQHGKANGKGVMTWASGRRYEHHYKGDIFECR